MRWFIELVKDRFILFLAYLLRLSDELVLLFVYASESGFELIKHFLGEALELFILIVTIFVMSEDDK